MRYIKHIIVILLVLLPLFLGCGINKINAQQLNIPSPYEGTWQYQDGNELFVVSLWKEDDGVFRGYYKKVEYNNGIIGATIFNSRKINANGVVFPPTIYATFDSTNRISGFVHDNTIENNPKDFKDGILKMQINSNCTNCTITAIWKIEEKSGMRVNFMPGFSIPTDVILTKVSNEIDLD